MFLVVAYLVHIFKRKNKKEQENDEGKVENEPHDEEIYVQMLRQYGANVLDFSSQYSCNSSRSYAACNIAGPPSSFPSYGDFVKSFVLRTYGKWWNIAPSASPKFKKISKSSTSLESNDFVDISFERPVIPKAIHILETYHPGSIIRVLALEPIYNEVSINDVGFKGRWVTLWSGPVQIQPAVSQNFAPPLQKTKKTVSVIRLEFNHEHLDYYTEIDAVELLGNIPRFIDTLCPPETCHDDFDTNITTKLMKQMSLCEETQTTECYSDNGFFDMLPSEIVYLIFLYLQLEDIFRAAATCRLFFRHCYDQVWFKELDLKPYWSKINDTALQGLRNRCTDTIKLNLSWCGPYKAISSRGFRKFLESSCQKLVCLRLSVCRFVDDAALHSIAKCCPQLQELDVSSCMKATDKGFKHISALKNLTRLNFYRVAISDNTLMDIIMCSSRLEHLNIGACPSLNRCDAIVICLKENCRSLVSLDLWRSSSLTSEGINQLAEGCPLLEELEIGWCSDVICSTSCVQNFVMSHPKLKKLYMAAIRSIGNEEVLAVAEHCPDIEQLDILGTSLVLPSTVRRFMAKRPALLFFDLSFCSQINRRFVEEMSAMYPKTSFKKSFTTNENDDDNNYDAE